MNNRGRANDDSIEELSFEDNRPPPRAGDLRVKPGRRDPVISAGRARKAGMTSGEIDVMNAADELDTDDDLSPATLLDEDTLDRNNLIAADKDLSIVDEDAIGEGYGLDEAELARVTGRPD
jgi:hypothetical protein